MKRFKHSLSHTVLSTFDMGELIPIGNFDVLPGDSIKMSTSMLIRCSPLATPVMHPVRVRIHHWFVPWRIVWDEFEAFITGGEDGEGDGYTYPQSTGISPAGELADYFGIPIGPSVSFSMLPFRSYNKVFNDNYRDQDLMAAVSENNGLVQNVAWEKDRFTTCRPWTQKGPDVTIPVAGTGLVEPVAGTPAPTFTIPGNANNPNALIGAKNQLGIEWSQAQSNLGGVAAQWADPKLQVDLSTLEASVNAVRRAMALQRFAEARAQYGSRYTEYLRYLGVRSADSRLQRPEYLGGGRSTISFSEVLNTGGQADGSDVPQGTMTGHGIAAVRTRPFIRFFEEHGTVLTLASVLPKTMYVSGLARRWSKRTKEDYWQRELERIGQAEVYNREINAGHTNPDGVFGYQDRYDEDRRLESYVTGEFRDTLNDWHFGRAYAAGATPTLNSAFITANPTKTPFAVQTNDVLWTMSAHSIMARRLLGHKTIGRIF